MDLKIYDSTLTIPAYGLKNTGVICYFNSLIQSLLSCTSFIQTILDVGYEQCMDKDDGHNKGSLASNELWQVLFYICRQIHDENKWNINYSVAIWSAFIKEIRKQKKSISFGLGQEDTHEALILFLDCLESKNHKEITRLFQHRYRCFITCPKCKVRHETEKEIGSIRLISFVDENDSKNSPLIEFLKNHTVNTDDNHVCEHCNFRGIKKMRYMISMLPEIFVILFKKYELKWQSNRPENLSFTTIDKYKNKNMTYNLVSQIEHSGNQRGGHYWTRSLRKDGVYILNDTDVQHQGRWTSGEPNTYIAFYHYIGLK